MNGIFFPNTTPSGTYTYTVNGMGILPTGFQYPYHWCES